MGFPPYLIEQLLKTTKKNRQGSRFTYIMNSDETGYEEEDDDDEEIDEESSQDERTTKAFPVLRIYNKLRSRCGEPPEQNPLKSQLGKRKFEICWR